MKIGLGEFNAKRVGKGVLNRQLAMKVYTKLVMIMELQWNILPHLKISQSKVQCSHIAVFINILGHLQMGTPTIRLTIS
jgi:hypothetical protein